MTCPAAGGILVAASAACPSTSTNATHAATASKSSGSSPIALSRRVPSAAALSKAAVGARVPIQGKRVVRHRLREEGRRAGRERAARRQLTRTPRARKTRRQAAAKPAARPSPTRLPQPPRPASQRRARARTRGNASTADCRLSRRARSDTPRICRRCPADAARNTRTLEESELVARVMPDTVDLARVDRAAIQQVAQTVGQLDLAGPVAFGRGQRRENVGRENVAADDREIRGRFIDATASRRDRVTRRRPRPSRLPSSRSLP